MFTRQMIKSVCVIIFTLSMIACSEKKPELELPTATPLVVYVQKITSPTSLESLKVDEKVTMQVTVKNIGNEPWLINGKNLVTLGYQWLSGAGKILQDGQGRVLLPTSLLPGGSVNLVAKVTAPALPGEYTLRFSMVQENIVWFYVKGAEPLVFKVKVK